MKSLKGFENEKIDFTSCSIIGGTGGGETYKHCWETTCNDGITDTYNQISGDNGVIILSYTQQGEDECDPPIL